ncbi:hypothetical protein [Glutamicibacter sp. NPDC087344]|uniref:hypothetical protein n=1 Tax=Glutamicibacter sp. NPDC087344 TaxID=3363994 RepID=UPI00381463EE
MENERERAGKALYESRSKNLRGLMMPDAPAWEELNVEVKERWCTTAQSVRPPRPRTRKSNSEPS